VSDTDRPIPLARPAAYVSLYPLLQGAARAHGYALSIHGSLKRDMDLVAIPWVEKASRPKTLVRYLAKAVSARVPSYITINGSAVEQPVKMPHGRECWVILLGGGLYLDVSVMPKRSS
jgi:hypothetical protein